MFGIKRRELEQLEDNISESFAAVRQDNANIRQWLQYFHQQNQRLQHKLDETEKVLARMPSSAAEIKQLIDAHYSFQPVLERIRRLERRVHEMSVDGKKVERLADRQEDVFDQLRELRSQIGNVQSHRRQNVVPKTGNDAQNGVQEKVLKMAVRNSKEFVKQSILKLIRLHGSAPGVVLRENIVEEQNLCSKSSFYRILNELEDEDVITVVRDGKEKIYHWSGAKQTTEQMT